MAIDLSKLPALNSKKLKRVGRGIGSGKGGHTTGRGAKGQLIRGKMDPLFEGSKQRKSLIRRTPFLRGKLRNKTISQKPVIINLKNLGSFKNHDTVSLDTLIKKGIVEAKAATFGVKLLGDGEIKTILKIHIKTSKSAAKKITKAGGTVESAGETDTDDNTKKADIIKAENQPHPANLARKPAKPKSK